MSSPSRSGAFNVDIDRQVELFTQSISVDQRLYVHDITASIAHAQMLSRQGILSESEFQQIRIELLNIQGAIDQGSFPFRVELEDIHMNIEQALIDRLGDLGRKLHTARSRNDQIATDMRLWIRQQIDGLTVQLRCLQSSFVGLAQREPTTIIPAYTHLRRAQPVLAAHYCLAWCEKLERDRQRLTDCRKRVNVCSLGSAAVAGTSLPIDRQFVAQTLGFHGITANSLDSSGDRDFVLEFVANLSLIALHLSSWAEDWIIWSTTEFALIQLPQQYCTGSSIMPHKINPDVLELIRGKTGRVLGALQTLLVINKGLPTAYNRDLQEDKPPLFDAVDTVNDCVQMAVGLVDHSHFDQGAISRTIEQGHLDATTLMEHLIRQGMPQRRAHHTVGLIVRFATEQGRTLAGLELNEYQSICPAIDQTVFEQVGVENALQSFSGEGSTAPDRVREELQRWVSLLAAN